MTVQEQRTETALESWKAIAAQRTGASLTEIFSPQLAMELDPPARFSPNGKRLAATDTGYLVVVDAATEKKTRLTATNWDQPPYGFAESPAWSPDGARIAYGWFEDKHWQQRVVAAGGGAPEVIFRQGDFLPTSWSPDGKQLAGVLRRPEGKTSLALVSIDGELTELRTWNNETITGATGATFSPDGRHVAYGVTIKDSTHVFLLDVTTKTETPVTSAPVTDRLPVWSRDGGSLLFVSDRSGRLDPWSVAVRDGRPAGEPRMVYADIGDVRSICGWDDEGRLVFTRQVTFGQLYTVAVDPSSGAALETPSKPVAQLEGKHMQAAWSPDRKQLALLAQTRQRGALYVADS